MKGSFMKLNCVSTFSGKGQFEILYYGTKTDNQCFRKEEKRQRGKEKKGTWILKSDLRKLVKPATASF